MSLVATQAETPFGCLKTCGRKRHEGPATPGGVLRRVRDASDDRDGHRGARLVGLCVLERTVSRARQVGTPVRLHLVEPAQLGGGVYSAEQPDFLVLNNACGQLSLYVAPDGDALPPYAVGLHPWAVVRGYRWVGYSAASAPEVTPSCPPITCPGG